MVGLKCQNLDGAKGASEKKDTFVHSIFCFYFCFCFAKCMSAMSYHHSLELTDVLRQSFLSFFTRENLGQEQEAFLKNI